LNCGRLGAVINDQSVIAVIPARGGSKRVPMKNVAFYRGRPLLQWAIDAAKESKYLDDFCVSSEDSNILGIALQLGAKAEKRPAWLATDRAMTEGVLIHLLYTWKWADWIVLLQPTSPLRTAEDIDTCIERASLDMGIGCLTLNEHGRRNGAVYVVKSEWLISSVEFNRDLDRNYLVMPNNRSLDIDYPPDFRFDPEREREMESSHHSQMLEQWKK